MGVPFDGLAPETLQEVSFGSLAVGGRFFDTLGNGFTKMKETQYQIDNSDEYTLCVDNVPVLIPVPVV